MNYEERLIALINDQMPSSPLRRSRSGEVDSELILLGGQEYLFSMDDFSHEDLLPEKDPFLLGWNLACAALSDLIAAGGNPLVYAHSMVIPQTWDEAYIKSFTQGISAVLQEYSVSFSGGDLGVSENWRYTASVLGKPLGRLINRKGCQAGDSILLTGKIGAGNLAALSCLFTGREELNGLVKAEDIRFPIHSRLAQIIAKLASCAIDTSDGVFAALHTISQLNETGFQIKNLPWHPQAALAAKALNLPELPLFLGECGEYEILFCIPRQQRDALLACLREAAVVASELGVITANPRQRILYWENHHIDLTDYSLRARDFGRVQDYLKAMLDWVYDRVTAR
ncbi:MAG TPA: AIR synthase related protein [Candidatus Cloacimonas sp.]|nr:AIR synthase related protein [Candidatus Cloacimonas sp.]